MEIDFKAYDVASAVVQPAGGFLKRLAGTFRGNTSTATWIQLHDAKALPANGAVPKRSWQVSDESPFQQTWLEVDFVFENGLVVALSTTEDELTLASETMDLFVEGESPFNLLGTTTVGDLTTGDDLLQVTADGTPKTLVRLEFTALSDFGATMYAMLFCKSPTTGDVSPFPYIELPANTSVDSFFGEFNMQSREVTVDGSIRETAQTINNGIFVGISTSKDDFQPEGLDLYYAIRATIK